MSHYNQTSNLRLLARKIMEKTADNPQAFDWSLQGLGMFRLYLSPEVRLHLFNTRFAVPDVSTAHSHPWHFYSTVLVGKLRNTRFKELSFRGSQFAEPYRKSAILCGTGGGLVRERDEDHCHPGEGQLVFLEPNPVELMIPGSVYYQDATEIHETHPMQGTVTICQRVFENADRDHATVYWPDGTDWVSAEPRKAKTEEILEAAMHCLRGWDNLAKGEGVF